MIFFLKDYIYVDLMKRNSKNIVRIKKGHSRKNKK